MAAERAVKPQRLICSLGSEQLPEELTPQTPFTTTSHQGTVELGFPLRVQETFLCVVRSCQTLLSLKERSYSLGPNAGSLGQQNKGASISEGAARLQENYLGPRCRGPLCFVSRSQQRRKREAWRGRDARQRESGRGAEGTRTTAPARAGGGGPSCSDFVSVGKPTNPTCSPVPRTREPRQRPGWASRVGQGRAVPLPLTLLSSSIFTFFCEMLFWILLLKLALPAARPHRSPSSRRQQSCPGPGPAAPGGPAADTAPAPGTSAPPPAAFPFPAEVAAAAAATTAATAAAASPPRLISSGVKPFMSASSGAPAPPQSPARRAAPPPSPGRPFTPHPKCGGGTVRRPESRACRSVGAGIVASSWDRDQEWSGS